MSGREKPDDRPAHGDEISPGGSRMLRHTRRTVPEEISTGDGDLIDAVSDHFECHVGPIGIVFHEIVSDLVHVDIHTIPPTDAHPYTTLFTTGMAEAPMTVPDGVDWRHAEMCTLLPPDWPLTEQAFKNEAHYWPVRWLKMCARLPHEFDTWFGPGHTMPNGDPPEPFAPGTPLSGVMAVHPFMFPDDAAELEFRTRTIRMLYMLPLTAPEMAFKLRHGADALTEKLIALGIPPPDLARPSRPCAVSGKRKRRWWPF